VPTLNGVDPHRLSKLWVPFLLINGGCTLRVAGQTLTDFVPVAFPITGISGVLEVMGLTLWAIHLWRIMSGRFALALPEASPPPIEEGVIAASDRVSAILDRYPFLLDTFLAFGFRPLSNPLLRRMMARHVTVAAACRHMDVNLEAFLAALNDARTQYAVSPTAIPHCCDSCARNDHHV
jgi:hypothetical protein